MRSILSRLYLRNRKVKEINLFFSVHVVYLLGILTGGVGIKHHGLTLIWPLTLP